MKKLLKHRYLYITIALILIAVVIGMARSANRDQNANLVTTMVETGSVRQLVSVSGIADAEQTADLAFPVTGIVREVFVTTGDEVERGDVLVTVDASSLYADRQDALAAVTKAVADRDELLAGPTGTDRDVTAKTLASQIENLETTKETEARRVANAYQALLSGGLTAYSEDENEPATPPTISGTYSCDTEGAYRLEIFNSKADSGYSYYLSGIETGTYTVSTEQPIAMGDCGLRIQFDENSRYGNSVWYIDIPNKKSPLYVTNRNTYTLAQVQAESAIALAEQAVALAEANATNDNAPARAEAVTRANAAITQAQARLARIDSTIADRNLVAPFAGTIVDITVLPGETVTTAPIVTLLAGGKFDVTARIPEIDIGKLLVDQRVEMLFDARDDEVLTGHISFISPQATEIDGVAYYEAIIEFDEIPVWMRSGLNADIDIIITEAPQSLRVPKRFVTKTDSGYEVLRVENGLVASTTVEVVMEGNDGYIALLGLQEGDVLLAP